MLSALLKKKIIFLSVLKKCTIIVLHNFQTLITERYVVTKETLVVLDLKNDTFTFNTLSKSTNKPINLFNTLTIQ